MWVKHERLGKAWLAEEQVDHLRRHGVVIEEYVEPPVVPAVVPIAWPPSPETLEEAAGSPDPAKEAPAKKRPGWPRGKKRK